MRRRLIFEKRIAYVKIGRHVRIESSVVDGLIEAGRIEAEAQAAAAGRRHLSIAEIRDEEVSRWRTSASAPISLEIEHEMCRGAYIDRSLSKTAFCEVAALWLAGKVGLRRSSWVRDESYLRRDVLVFFGSFR